AKPRTITTLKQSRDKVVQFFGADRELASITEADADAFAEHLRLSYADASVATFVKHARRFFRHACRARLLTENPFTDVSPGSFENQSRQFFVPADWANRIIQAAPDAQWRGIVALARFGGLRCPSDILALGWADIDWERSRFLVRSPK